MSSILEALRKLEQERARKRDAAPEIAADILRSDLRRKQLPLWFWPVAVGTALLLATALLWKLFADAPTPPHASVPQASPVVTEANRYVAPQGAVVIEEVIDSRRPQPLTVGVTPPAQPAPIPPAPPAVVVQPAVAPPTISTPPAVSPPPASEPAQNYGLTVSGIAWQEERSARMAVVNNLPVMEGDRADDAVVEEIARDGVTFTRNGERFTVKMSQ